ncbi:LPS translocon maturation chaperone LptM [Rhodoferax sp.]|uniref:LPS translocon maturation chaperone LptM n=1 Tax=Rhodoferax sp. TaxID=50421 RepID=UPI00275DDE3D|nr:lipoprotein [Rhodoferax sp.]
MLLPQRILVTPLALAVSAVTLAACGQHGALYLPTDAPPGKRPTAQTAPPSPVAPADATAPAAKPASQ